MAILAMLFLVGTFGLNFPIFISAMAVNVFHADVRGYGVLSSLMAIGALAGALAGAGAKPRFPWLGLAAAAIGGGFVHAAVAPGYWSFAAALVVIGLATLVFTNATNTLMQLSTEPAMRGRVMALRVGIALGGTPVGAPIVGWVADDCGPRWALGAGRWALGVGAASGFAAALVAVFAIARAGCRALAIEPPDGRMHMTGPVAGQRKESE